ncbi:MAG: hypothetical protein GFH25_541324n22 [Chloroflexi bacterium AL-N10]|nr:hypothetical protein [Chloroflexi bacterium AL-N10]
MPIDYTSEQDIGSKSGIFYKILGLLSDKTRVGLGLVVGAGLSALSNIFAPQLSTVDYINLTERPWWTYFALGIFIIHIPLIFKHMISIRSQNDEVDLMFKLIRMAKKTGVPTNIIARLHLLTTQVIIEERIKEEKLETTIKIKLSKVQKIKKRPRSKMASHTTIQW